MVFIGTAGIPHSSPKKDTISGIKEIKRLGLSAIEIEFVERIYLNERSAKEVCRLAKSLGILLTAHAPYYINLANTEKQSKSIEILVKTAIISDIAGVKSVAFHAGYRGTENHKKNIYEGIKKLKWELEKLTISTELRPETAGKTYQFGEIDEVIEIYKEYGMKFCVDFAHIFARSKGKINGEYEFSKVLEKIAKECGDHILKDMHIHIEGIEFGEKGEIRHLNFSESKIDVVGLIKALKSFEVEGVIICESPSLESDALKIKELFFSLPDTIKEVKNIQH